MAIELKFIEQPKLEKAILDRLLYTRESTFLTSMVSKQIDESYFIEPLHQKIFGYIKQYFSENSTIPSETHIDSIFSGYVVIQNDDNVNSLVDELIRRWTQRKNQEVLAQMMNANKDNGDLPIELIAELQRIQSIKKRTQRGDYFISSSAKFVEDYEEKIRNNVEFTGIKIGLPYIDKEFGGIQSTDFIGILADEKKGKSWIMLWIAYQMICQGKKVIFFSPEMDNDEVLQRLHLIHSNLNSTNFYQGKLTDEDFAHWKDKNTFIRELQQKTGAEFVSIDDIEIQDFNISTIKSRLKTIENQMKNAYMKKLPHLKESISDKKHLFDAMIIDGFHMLNGSDVVSRGASEWKESQKVSQSLRSFARIEKIPILVSLHTNRDKQKEKEKLIPDQSDTSMTASLGRDVTLLISLFSNPAMKSKKKLGMAAPISRRSASKIWQIDFDPDFGKITPNEKVQNEKEFIDELNGEELK